MHHKLENFFWGISERSDGQMKLYGDGRDEATRINRTKFLERHGLRSSAVVSADLVHGTNVAFVGQADAGKTIQVTDALISDCPCLILTVTVADCLPVYFFDPINRAVGIAHAGWRGVEADIVRKVVERMAMQFGTRPSDLHVEIGPHIQRCHFEIQADVAHIFSAYPDCIIRKDGKTTIDLQSIVKRQLTTAGIKSENVGTSTECTYCLPEKYFSYRRDKPEAVMSMLAYVGIKA